MIVVSVKKFSKMIVISVKKFINDCNELKTVEPSTNDRIPRGQIVISCIEN